MTNISINSKNPLATEKVSTLFIKLAIPAVVAQIVNLLYNMVDRMYIGRLQEVGAIALTGIGVSSPLLMTISAFAVLLGAGGAPQASRLLGAKEKGKAETVLSTAFSTAVLLGLALSIILLSFLKPILLMLGASAASLPYAYDYASIYLVGTVFVMVSLGMNQFISVQGFAKAAMGTTLIGAILNIILDPIFIFTFSLGVKGAALATILSQAISAIYVTNFLRSSKSHLHLVFAWPKVKVLMLILALGFSPFIMNATESLLQMSFNRSLFFYGGDLAVATMSVNSMIRLFSILPVAGFAQGAVSLISFNYGAKNIKRIKETVKLLVATTLGLTIFFTCILELFPSLFVKLFTSNSELINATIPTLRIYVAGTFLAGLQMGCQNAFIAFSQAKLSACMALLRKIVLLIPLIYILPNFIQPQVYAVYAAEPVSDTIAALVTAYVFFRFLKSELKRLANEI